MTVQSEPGSEPVPRVPILLAPDDAEQSPASIDPGVVVCECGYFLSCSDYY